MTLRDLLAAGTDLNVTVNVEEAAKVCSAYNAMNYREYCDVAEFASYAEVTLPAALVEVEALRAELAASQRATQAAVDRHKRDSAVLESALGGAKRQISLLAHDLANKNSCAAVLRPLTESEVVAALHEGRAEAMAATGDNAWTSLLTQRDTALRDLEAVRVEEFMALDARNMAEAALDAMKREYAKLSAALWMAFHSGVCVGHATPEGGTVARYREQFELWRKEQP